MIAHQRQIRDREAATDPRPVDTVIDYTVVAVRPNEAKEFILRYEWLGTVGRPQAHYGARNAAGELAAVALFGLPTNGGDLCGKQYRQYTIALERGACAHWAYPHTASWFIPKACAMAARDRGWNIFYAYADEAAGEIGTVYQACSWLYLGQTPDRRIGGWARDRDYFRHRDWPLGKLISDRTFFSRYRLSMRDVERGEWERVIKPAKHKYVWIEARRGERRELIKLLPPSQPYPKRFRVTRRNSGAA